MGNLTENKLNATLTAADLTAINTALSNVAAKLPVISLNDEQRSTLKAMDVNNKVFVQDAINAIANSSAGIVPPFISQANLQNDLSLYEQMDTLEGALKNLMQRVSDIKRVTGDEAYTGALAAYKIFSSASSAGILNAKQPYEQLRSRFEGQGGRTAEQEP